MKSTQTDVHCVGAKPGTETAVVPLKLKDSTSTIVAEENNDNRNMDPTQSKTLPPAEMVLLPKRAEYYGYMFNKFGLF